MKLVVLGISMVLSLLPGATLAAEDQYDLAVLELKKSGVDLAAGADWSRPSEKNGFEKPILKMFLSTKRNSADPIASGVFQPRDLIREQAAKLHMDEKTACETFLRTWARYFEPVQQYRESYRAGEVFWLPAIGIAGDQSDQNCSRLMDLISLAVLEAELLRKTGNEAKAWSKLSLLLEIHLRRADQLQSFMQLVVWRINLACINSAMFEFCQFSPARADAVLAGLDSQVAAIDCANFAAIQGELIRLLPLITDEKYQNLANREAESFNKMVKLLIEGENQFNRIKKKPGQVNSREVFGAIQVSLQQQRIDKAPIVMKLASIRTSSVRKNSRLLVQQLGEIGMANSKVQWQKDFIGMARKIISPSSSHLNRETCRREAIRLIAQRNQLGHWPENPSGDFEVILEAEGGEISTKDHPREKVEFSYGLGS